jgi:hypothetical protein
VSNSTSILPDVLEGTGAVATINEMFDAASVALTGARDATTSNLLTWGYIGGRISGSNKANGTVTLAASSTNYVVMAKSGLAVSVSTSTTNWNDSANYWRLYSVVTGSATATSWNDERFGDSGLFPVATAASLTNPMTTAGDMIVGGTSGTPARLAATTNGFVLTLAAGVPVWSAAPGGFSNPMTTSGDLILGGASGAAGRLGIGSTGQVLTVSGGTAVWAASASGFANPMTTAGDLITGGVSGTAGRLGIGNTGDVLTVVSGAPAWAPPGIEQNSQSTAYTLVLGDKGKQILHPSADTTARIFTIPANASVAFPINTAVTFINQNAAGTLTIAITTDTMRLAGAGTTGSRTLAANGIATAVKVTATEWIISGVGLT